MSFLDWNIPEAIISRSELYLENGFPIQALRILKSLGITLPTIRMKLKHSLKK